MLERDSLGSVVEAGIPRLRILLVTQAFPPFNTSGAVRMGKLATFLTGRGHEIRVLTASPLPYPRTLGVEIPPELIIQTRSFDPLVFVQWLRRRADRTGSTARPPSAASRVQLRHWVSALAIPEPQVGWYPYAVSAGRRLIREWRPDVIYASALPFTAHLVAARLGQGFSIPWVAEFRDHFYGNPYSNLPAWREGVDRFIERRVVSSASACITVSEPMAQTLRCRYGKRTMAVLNGCDARPSTQQAEPARRGLPLRIVYTGVIYPGRRDPSALFAAVAALDGLAAQIEVIFYGQDLRGVADLSAKYGVTGSVRLREPIPHDESLREQQRADVLLLLLWNDPRELGGYTGKLFEYISAGRQILAIGAQGGVAADLIRSREFGVVASDPLRIAAVLRAWIEEKVATGQVCGPGPEARAGLTREEQFAKADELLHELHRTHG
jgi:hypothetical protein